MGSQVRRWETIGDLTDSHNITTAKITVGPAVKTGLFVFRVALSLVGATRQPTGSIESEPKSSSSRQQVPEARGRRKQRLCLTVFLPGQLMVIEACNNVIGFMPGLGWFKQRISLGWAFILFVSCNTILRSSVHN